MPLTLLPRNQAGFSLPELIASVSVVLITLLGFTTLITAVTSTAATAEFQRELTRTVDREHKLLAAVSFNNLMLSPSDATNVCLLDDTGRLSTQSVKPGPDVRIVETTEVTITREVVWASSNTPVECTSGNKDRSDDKIVTITATWDTSNGTQTSTASIRYSPTTNPATTPRESQPAPPLSAVASTDDAASWCPGASTVEVDDTDAVLLGLRFTDASELTCGYTFTGLTPGQTYTAVTQVFVPPGVTATIANDEGFTGNIAVGQDTFHTISVTFTAFAPSTTIEVGVQADWDTSQAPSMQVANLLLYG